MDMADVTFPKPSGQAIEFGDIAREFHKIWANKNMRIYVVRHTPRMGNSGDATHPTSAAERQPEF